MAEKLLMEINDNVELYLYEGILKQNKIPYAVKRPNVRGYNRIILGEAHAVPAEIYVNEEDLQRAMEYTSVVRTEKRSDPAKKGTSAHRSRKIFAWTIVGMFLLMLLIWAVQSMLK